MNYERATSANHSNKCEFLHYLLDNTSCVLDINPSFEYLFLDKPVKVIGKLDFNFELRKVYINAYRTNKFIICVAAWILEERWWARIYMQVETSGILPLACPTF